MFTMMNTDKQIKMLKLHGDGIGGCVCVFFVGGGGGGHNSS